MKGRQERETDRDRRYAQLGSFTLLGYTSSPYARLHLFRLHVAHVRERDGETYIHIYTYITRRFPRVIPSKVATQAAF